MTTPKKPTLILNITFIILELIGTSISLSHGVGSLMYYTVLSNITGLISSIALTYFLFKKADIPAAVVKLRFGASVCLAVTFLVVVAIFVPMAVPYGTVGDVLYKGPQLYHHLLCPVISFVSFCFFESGELSRRSLLAAVSPTLLYAAVMTTLNIARVVYGPYPFLHVYEQSPLMSVIWLLLINGIALAMAAVIRGIHNKRSG